MTSDDISTRVATPQDEEFLRRIFFVVRAPEFQAAGLGGEQLDLLLSQQYHAMSTHYHSVYPETVYTILEMEGKPIGFEALDASDEELHLVDFALMPEARNQGLGTDRIKKLQSLAVEKQMPITLSVEIFNPARRLYERLGFQLKEEQGIFLRLIWHPTNP